MLVGRRWKAIALAAVTAAVMAAPASPAASAGAAKRDVTAVNALESAVLVEINALRRGHGLAPLRTSARLRRAADAHSGAMATRGFFGHESQDGTSFWKRIERFYGSSRYRYWSVGENLLWSSPSLDAADALQMWLDSPGHRKVLLTPRWREIGLSAVHAASAPGTFGGQEVTIVTADFGVRR